jgi:glycosyltransferase involved in cell wall biosynthesis
MHVTMAIQAYAPTVGGGELQLQRLVPQLAARGIRSRIITRGVDGWPRREPYGDGVVIRTRVAGESPAASVVYVGTAIGDLARHRFRTDVVHAHGALSPATIALGATYLRLPAVVTPLGAGPPGDLARLQHKPGGRRRLALLVRRAHFVALSNALADELRGLGVPDGHLHEIPNGFDAASFHAVDDGTRATLRTELGLPVDAFVVLFTGRLHPVKNVGVVIDALAHVPEPALLVVVGDGPDRAALEARARAAHVAGRVRFTGVTDRVHQFMQAADVFVLPSIAEGMSNALLEAMACALPCVVTSSISGTDELLTAARGLCVGDASPAAWAAAIRALATDPARRRSLGAAAAAFVNARFSIEHTADQLARLYRSLAST